MSLEKPPKNKMMTAAPAQKQEFFFAPTPNHPAEVIYASTIEEAQHLYQKRLQSKAPAAPLSTPEPATEDEGVQ